jgi:nitroreductase
MSVTEAVSSRMSKRAFLDRPVSGDLVRRILSAAARSPSGGNLQPWNVIALGGEELARFKALIAERMKTNPFADGPEYEIYPENLGEPYRSRRKKCGEDMYATMGIPRGDDEKRMAFVGGNFSFWNAPVGLFFCIDRRLIPTQWVDLGIYLQSVMLLAREAGLHTCAQEAWTVWHRTVCEFLELPPNMLLFCGMAVGYADESHPVNRLRTERAELDEFASFRGL